MIFWQNVIQEKCYLGKSELGESVLGKMLLGESVQGEMLLSLCILHNAAGQDGFPADQWDAYTGQETSVRYIVDFVLQLDNQMLKFVFSKKHISRRFETADYDGGNVLVDSIPGGPGGFRDARDDPDLHEEGEGVLNLGEAVAGGQYSGDDDGERAVWYHGDPVDGCSLRLAREQGCTGFDGP